jgi:Ca2+-binding RTX toxin-like protein
MGGGSGADRFSFAGAAETGVGFGNHDVIADFSRTDADTIDLQLIDADATTAGDEAFAFIGSAGFAGTAGQLRADAVGSDMLVQADTDGDGAADFEILLQGNASDPMLAADFAL